MAVLDLLDLPAALPPYAPVLGLDLGEKTIGVAVSDATLAIASPLELIHKGKFTDVTTSSGIDAIIARVGGIGRDDLSVVGYDSVYAGPDRVGDTGLARHDY